MGIMTDDDAFGWNKKKVPEIKEELKTDKTTDKLLLDKIRAKIDAGEFEIDYQKIANGMMGDTIAALGSKVRSK